jgi:hypothetical protein
MTRKQRALFEPALVRTALIDARKSWIHAPSGVTR